jgi:hypothetical protein
MTDLNKDPDPDIWAEWDAVKAKHRARANIMHELANLARDAHRVFNEGGIISYADQTQGTYGQRMAELGRRLIEVERQP